MSICKYYVHVLQLRIVAYKEETFDLLFWSLNGCFTITIFQYNQFSCTQHFESYCAVKHIPHNTFVYTKLITVTHNMQVVISSQSAYCQ